MRTWQRCHSAEVCVYCVGGGRDPRTGAALGVRRTQTPYATKTSAVQLRDGVLDSLFDVADKNQDGVLDRWPLLATATRALTLAHACSQEFHSAVDNGVHSLRITPHATTLPDRANALQMHLFAAVRAASNNPVRPNSSNPPHAHAFDSSQPPKASRDQGVQSSMRGAAARTWGHSSPLAATPTYSTEPRRGDPVIQSRNHGTGPAGVQLLTSQNPPATLACPLSQHAPLS